MKKCGLGAGSHPDGRTPPHPSRMELVEITVRESKPAVPHMVTSTHCSSRTTGVSHVLLPPPTLSHVVPQGLSA